MIPIINSNFSFITSRILSSKEKMRERLNMTLKNMVLILEKIME